MLHRLVDAGNTVIVIEHNLDVLKTADHIIDLGPGGGDGGGEIVAAGTPEEVAANPRSATGEYLARMLPRPADATVARVTGTRVATPRPRRRVPGLHLIARPRLHCWCANVVAR